MRTALLLASVLTIAELPTQALVAASAAPAAAETATPATAKSPASQPGRPVPNPDPRNRAIPELVCTGERTVTVAHNSLVSSNVASPLRLRMRGNLLYLGQDVNTEKFYALINRADRRRWTAGNATLILDEALEQGVWVMLELGTTRVSAVFCQPFEAKR